MPRSPDIYVHEGHVVVVQPAGPPGLVHPFREPDLAEIPQGFPRLAALLGTREEPGRHRVRAHEEVIAFGDGSPGEPDVIHDRSWIGIAASQEGGAGVEAAAFAQREGGLEPPVTYVEEARIANRRRSPLADDTRYAGIHVRLRIVPGRGTDFHLEREDGGEGAPFDTGTLIPAKRPGGSLTLSDIGVHDSGPSARESESGRSERSGIARGDRGHRKPVHYHGGPVASEEAFGRAVSDGHRHPAARDLVSGAGENSPGVLVLCGRAAFFGRPVGDKARPHGITAMPEHACRCRGTGRERQCRSCRRILGCPHERRSGCWPHSRACAAAVRLTYRRGCARKHPAGSMTRPGR